MSYTYIYGPIASRRLGKSLGVAPITNNVCNYSCVYCQLGKINLQPHHPEAHFPLDDILSEINHALANTVDADVVSIVGDGEPTLHKDLDTIIDYIRTKTTRPIAIITNGALLSDHNIQQTLHKCDIVCPSLDAFDAQSFKRINRPYRGLTFEKMLTGLINFSHQYQGKLWLEIMFVEGLNTHETALKAFKNLLSDIRYDRLYLNAPVRPAQKSTITPITSEMMNNIQATLGGIPLDYLSLEAYQTLEDTPLAAIKSLVKRHPLTLHEIDDLLTTRFNTSLDAVFEHIKNDPTLKISAHGPFYMVSYQG